MTKNWSYDCQGHLDHMSYLLAKNQSSGAKAVCLCVCKSLNVLSTNLLLGTLVLVRYGVKVAPAKSQKVIERQPYYREYRC